MTQLYSTYGVAYSLLAERVLSYTVPLTCWLWEFTFSTFPFLLHQWCACYSWYLSEHSFCSPAIRIFSDMTSWRCVNVSGASLAVISPAVLNKLCDLHCHFCTSCCWVMTLLTCNISMDWAQFSDLISLKDITVYTLYLFALIFRLFWHWSFNLKHFSPQGCF